MPKTCKAYVSNILAQAEQNRSANVQNRLFALSMQLLGCERAKKCSDQAALAKCRIICWIRKLN